MFSLCVEVKLLQTPPRAASVVCLYQSVVGYLTACATVACWDCLFFRHEVQYPCSKGIFVESNCLLSLQIRTDMNVILLLILKRYRRKKWIFCANVEMLLSMNAVAYLLQSKCWVQCGTLLRFRVEVEILSVSSVDADRIWCKAKWFIINGKARSDRARLWNSILFPQLLLEDSG